MSAVPATPTVTRLGPYQLIAKIGEGGISTVHLGLMDGPAGFSKLAAIKELHPDLNASSKMRAMFLNEMRLAARLAHPNVVHAYGANEDAGRLYLAMEYLDGQPWSRARRVLRARGSLPSDLHLKVLAEVLAGLHYAHELREYDGSPLQVVHCDVSPQNVFVTYEGRVKVVDFGVARAMFRGDTASRDVIAGKLSYIAPEQLRGEAFDRRADIFAVGVMLWEAMSGKRFAQNKGGDETRRRRESGIEPRVGAVVPDAPAQLVEICDRALALDPAARFATAAEFREALLEYLGEDMRDVDRLLLDVLVNDAFRDERGRMRRILNRYLKEPSSVTSSMERLIPRRESHEGAVEIEQNGVATQPLLPRRKREQFASGERLAAGHHRPSGQHSAVEHPVVEQAEVGHAAAASRWNPATTAHHARAVLAAARRRWKLVLPLVGTGCVVLGISIATLASSPESDAHASTDRPSSAPGRVRDIDATHASAASTSTPAANLNAASNPFERAPQAPGTIQLSITATPKSVRLYLDGVPLAENPYLARVRADQQMHIIRAGSGDRRSQSRIAAFDRDQTVSFDLEVDADGRPAARTRSVATFDKARHPRDADASRARPQKPDDSFDRALMKRGGSRPIYEDDPYR